MVNCNSPSGLLNKVVQWIHWQWQLPLDMGISTSSSGLDKKAVNGDSRTTTAAARYGHLDLLKWLRLNNCPWDEWTISQAVRGGRIDIVIWLHEAGCPSDQNTCTSAVQMGHLDILKWLLANGYPYDMITLLSTAKIYGHSQLVDYLNLERCRIGS